MIQCPSCPHDNADTQKFCGECGARLGTAAAGHTATYALAQEWEKAQHYLFKAGDQAGRMAADAEALEHYRRAEGAYMKVAARELTPLQRATLDRKLGQAFYGVGNYDLAIEHCTRALWHLGIHYPKTRLAIRRSALKFLATHVFH